MLARKGAGKALVNGLNLVPARRKLRMAPGWFGFSLERDEAQYKELTQKVEASEAKIEGMLTQTFAIAEQAGSHSTKAQVLVCAGQVYFNRYMNLKTEYVKGTAIIPGVLLRLLRPYRLDDFVHFTKDERAKMNACLDQCKASYLTAADEFQRTAMD
ncbi:MAG: hypothetical protein L0387_38390 [Acidobacteria bacterium]|nr:hypothetical protein [Acidobacteriota bacterium]